MEKEKKSFKIYLRILWITVVTILFTIIIFFALIANGKLGFMPTFEDLENPKSYVASEIITSDNQILGKYYKSENRTLVDYEDINKYLVEALVATEDERFYEHSGVDLRSFFRAVKGIVTNNHAGGGSTISQQLAKLLFPRESNSGIKLVIRKFREWVIAVKLERSYTKNEIIAMYLNKFEFIDNAFGIETASQTYFNIPQDSLQLHQAAVLVGMLKNPYYYNPRRFTERSKHRRNVVLGQMLKNHYLNIEQFDTTKVKPLDLNYNRSSLKGGIAPYFRKYLERTMVAQKPVEEDYSRNSQKYYEDSIAWHNNPLYGWCNKNLKPDGEYYDLYADGIKIYTTINYSMQEYAENAVEWNLKRLQPALDAHVKNFRNPPFSNDLDNKTAKNLLMTQVYRSNRYKTLKKQGLSKERIMKIFNTPDTLMVYTWEGYKDTIMSPLDSIKYYLRHLSSSFMAMNPQTGNVKAWVGGAAYGFTEIDMVRSATYKRQVGSTCKPFLYTTAIENGLSPCKKVPNIPHTLVNPDGSLYTAKNSSRTEYDGEMVTLKWGLAHSVNQISAWVMKQYGPAAMKGVMQRMGIISDIPEVNSLFLGPAEITLYEMIAAYSVFANKGVYTSPIIVSRIEDKNGNILATFSPSRHEAISENTAYTMTNLLQNVVSTGSGLRLKSKAKVFEEYGGFKANFCGKTGTTQNQSDGWFVGFTPDLVAGVWTGANLRSIHFEDITRGQGSNMALPVFGKFFKQVFANKDLGYSENFEFEKPANFNMDLDCGEQFEKEEEKDPTFDIVW